MARGSSPVGLLVVAAALAAAVLATGTPAPCTFDKDWFRAAAFDETGYWFKIGGAWRQEHVQEWPYKYRQRRTIPENANWGKVTLHHIIPVNQLWECMKHWTIRAEKDDGFRKQFLNALSSYAKISTPYFPPTIEADGAVTCMEELASRILWNVGNTVQGPEATCRRDDRGGELDEELVNSMTPPCGSKKPSITSPEKEKHAHIWKAWKACKHTQDVKSFFRSWKWLSQQEAIDNPKWENDPKEFKRHKKEMADSGREVQCTGIWHIVG